MDNDDTTFQDDILTEEEHAASSAAIAVLSESVGVDLAAPARTTLLHQGVLAISGSSSSSRCILFNDALVVVVPPKKARGAATVDTYPLLGAIVEDLTRYERTDATCVDSFDLRPSGSGRCLRCTAPNGTEKLAWLSSIATAIADSAAADVRMEVGWHHSLHLGTLWAASIAGDVEAVKELCAYTLSGRQRGLVGSLLVSGGRVVGDLLCSAEDMAPIPQQPVLDVDAVDDGGMSALHYAVTNGHPDVVEALLEAGASSGVVDSDMNTPLHLAVLDGKDDIALMLISNEAALDRKNLVEQTPLVAALSSRTQDGGVVERIVGSLLAYGADACERDLDGLSPIHHATLRRLPGLVTLLARHGADVNVLTAIHPGSSGDGAAAGVLQVSALHLGAGQGLATSVMLDYLRNRDQDQEEEEGSETTSPLPPALDLDTLATLLNNGAQPNLQSHPSQETPLHTALRAMAELKAHHFGSPAGRERYATSLAGAMKLVNHGARMDVRDATSATPLELAAELGLSPPLEMGAEAFRSLAPPQEAAAASALLALRSAAKERRQASGAVHPSPASKPSPAAGGLLGRLQLVGRSLVPGQWAPDNAAGGCTVCGAAFALLNRRHHCRACGSLVCGDCSSKRFPFPAAPASQDGGEDSDDDDAVGAAGRGSGAAKAAAVASKQALSSLWGALSTPPPSSAELQQPHQASGSSSVLYRVCDGCFNALCFFSSAELVAERAGRSDIPLATVVVRGVSDAARRGTAGKPSFESFTGSSSGLLASAGAGASPSHAARPASASMPAASDRAQLFGARGGAAAAARTSAGAGASPTAAESEAALRQAATARSDGIKAAMAEAQQRIAQRGERLANLGERSRDMADNAATFASLSSQLKNKSKWGFF